MGHHRNLRSLSHLMLVLFDRSDLTFYSKILLIFLILVDICLKGIVMASFEKILYKVLSNKQQLTFIANSVPQPIIESSLVSALTHVEVLFDQVHIDITDDSLIITKMGVK